MSSHCFALVAFRPMRINNNYKGLFGRVRTKAYPGHFLGKYPADFFGKARYRPQYPTEHSGKVRYELDTGTHYFGKFGTPTKNTPGRVLVYPTRHTLAILYSPPSKRIDCPPARGKGNISGDAWYTIRNPLILALPASRPSLSNFLCSWRGWRSCSYADHG